MHVQTVVPEINETVQFFFWGGGTFVSCLEYKNTAEE